MILMVYNSSHVENGIFYSGGCAGLRWEKTNERKERFVLKTLIEETEG